MEALILIIIPLVISGLGFLTYRHPPIARKILVPIEYAVCGIYCFIQIYSLVQSNAYYDAKDIASSYINVSKMKIPEYSLSNSKDKDSILIARIERKYEFDKYFEIQKVKLSISDSIQTKLSSIIETHKKKNNTYILYCVFAFFITIVLIGLSFLFDNIHDKEKVENDNKTK